MLFGDRACFAIDVEVRERIDNWVYGRLFFWVEDKVVGNPDDSVDLKGCCHWLRDFVEHPVDRVDPRLEGVPALGVLELLGIFDGRRGRPAIPDGQQRFPIGHLGMSTFDRFDLVLVDLCGRGQRIVWREARKEACDAVLPSGTIERVVAECVSWLQYELGKGGDESGARGDE